MCDARPIRLPLIPPLGRKESLRGYMQRLAHDNFNSRTFRPFMNGLKQTAAILELITTWSGISAEGLAERVSVVKHGEVERVRIGTSLLHPMQILRQSRQVCPMCLAEDGISRCAWDLVHYTVCSRHGVALASQCDGCNRPLNWGGTFASRCSCGRSLKAITTQPGPEYASKRSHLLDRAVNTSLGIEGDDPYPLGIGELIAVSDVFDHVLFPILMNTLDHSERRAAMICYTELKLLALYDDDFVAALWAALLRRLAMSCADAQIHLQPGPVTARQMQRLIPEYTSLASLPAPWKSTIPLHLRIRQWGKEPCFAEQDEEDVIRVIGSMYLEKTAKGWKVPIAHIAAYRDVP